ncbi:MAG: hypothetical protein HZY78_10615 [Burkholderiaceae bacterium]|nr:MAG: hypothetical protein HZY78_10615 [Burkholderiaceae bacterium]
MNPVLRRCACLPRPLGRGLARLNQTGRGILLVVDAEGRLLRTVTDGDLRRAVLAGVNAQAPLSTLPAQAPVVADEAASAEPCCG